MAKATGKHPVVATGSKRKKTAAVPMRESTADYRVAPAALSLAISPDNFSFSSTAEIEPLEVIIGQERALEALDLGLGIEQEGYNIFVAGLTGTGKMGIIRQELLKRAEATAPPSDWVYLFNFDEPDCPWAIALEPGGGRKLKKQMQQLVDALRDRLPKAFRQEDFSQEKEKLGEKYHSRFQSELEKLSDLAKERNYAIRRTGEGHLVFVPLVDGKPVDKPEELEELPEDTKSAMEDAQKLLAREASRLMEDQQEMIGEMSGEVEQAERRFATQLVQPLIDRLKREFPENQRLQEYLDRIADYTLDNLGLFRSGAERETQMSMIPGLSSMLAESQPQFLEYQVNVAVDHGRSKNAPVVVEDSPTYRSLFGSIERFMERGGRVVTNFMQIKAGSLMRASGGYLVFNLQDALTEPLVYKFLKRTLRSGQIHYEVYDPWYMFTSGALRPEPIPIRTKVVVLGSPWLFYALRFYDDEFEGLFKIKADFGTEMPRGEQEQMLYAQFIARLTRDEKLLPFDRQAVAEIIRFGARRTGNKDKLLTRFSEVADIIREATFVARREKMQTVTAEHVESACQKRIFRSDRIARKIEELIKDGTILVDLQGRRIGQVNGLAVIDVGEWAFGKPSRVTSSLGLGAEGVINIEREAKLSGSTHDKGILILSGYLRNKYGRNKPLALSASICFEQSYGGVDGDSASAAELFVLLSNLAELPLRQDIAVTGSVNQWGEIQAVGGVNEKVEGFYDICKTIGLTGDQGVCLPRSNVKNLILRNDVRRAIEQGEFHIYAIASVEEGLELLSGIQAGDPKSKGTVHWKVDQALFEMAHALNNFDSVPESTSLVAGKQQITPEVPPKLPDDNP